MFSVLLLTIVKQGRDLASELIDDPDDRSSDLVVAVRCNTSVGNVVTAGLGNCFEYWLKTSSNAFVANGCGV